jgi:hypothetical protein
MDTEYQILSVENLKKKSAKGNITFSLPLAIKELLGEVFVARLRNKFYEFICTAFGVDKEGIDIEAVRKYTLAYKALLIVIKSKTPDLIINGTGMIAKRILKAIIADHPDIVYKSGIHLNKKTHMHQEDASIDIVNEHMIKDIMNDMMYSMIKATSSDVFIIPLPKKVETYRKYGHLEIAEYMDNLISSTLSHRFNYKVSVYENLNINDDNEIAKSNLEFVENLLSHYVTTNCTQLQIYLVKSQNKVILIQLSNVVLPNWNELFQLKSCISCYQDGFIRQNMLPVKADEDLCIICAKEAMKSREFEHDKHGCIPCFAGECGAMFFMYRQGTYIISDKGRPIKAEDAVRLPWLYRSTLFLEHLEKEYHPKFLAMLDVPSATEPDNDNADIMYHAIKDKLESVTVNITDYTTELQIFGADTTAFMKPFVDLTTSINEFRQSMETDHSNVKMLEYSKHTGKFIRQIGAVYYPHAIDANSPYQLGDISINVHETLPHGIIPSGAMIHIVNRIFDILEEVRCYCFCEHCKTFLMKINNCDTGNCTKCSRAFCMEHGTTLSEMRASCKFERENNTKCAAFYHTVDSGFRWDNVPQKLTSTCVCVLHTPHVTN